MPQRKEGKLRSSGWMSIVWTREKLHVYSTANTERSSHGIFFWKSLKKFIFYFLSQTLCNIAISPRLLGHTHSPSHHFFQLCIPYRERWMDWVGGFQTSLHLSLYGIVPWNVLFLEGQLSNCNMKCMVLSTVLCIHLINSQVTPTPPDLSMPVISSLR